MNLQSTNRKPGDLAEHQNKMQIFEAHLQPRRKLKGESRGRRLLCDRRHLVVGTNNCLCINIEQVSRQFQLEWRSR